MPVRIYEIAKRLGIESKEVLSKAKELGIAAARVPSSSLDKITAEYLEEKLGGAKVAEAAPPAAILDTSAPTETVTAQPPIEPLPATIQTPPAPAAPVESEAKAPEPPP